MAIRQFSFLLLLFFPLASMASQWKIGAGALYSQSSYRDYDARLLPLPMIAYQGERWYLQGLTGGFRLIDSKTDESPFGNTLVAEVGLGGGSFDPDRSDSLAELDSRRVSVDGGLKWTTSQRWGSLSVSASTDISGAYNGQQLGLAYGFPLFLSDSLRAFGSVSVDWYSERWSRYYYGISADESRRSGLPAFEPDDALNPGMTVTLFYQLDENWSLQGIVSRSWLDSALWDSPMVGGVQDDSLLVGLSFAL